MSADTKGANARQVGGSHYEAKDGVQHWDYVMANNLDYLQGNAIKYIARCRKKNGLQDLEKALHYIEKMKEVYGYNDEPVRKPTEAELAAVVSRLGGGPQPAEPSASLSVTAPPVSLPFPDKVIRCAYCDLHVSFKPGSEAEGWEVLKTHVREDHGA